MHDIRGKMAVQVMSENAGYWTNWLSKTSRNQQRAVKSVFSTNYGSFHLTAKKYACYFQIPRRAEKTPSTACLQPLDNTRSAGRVISDLLTRSSPVIRPLRATEPIPPIASQPSTYS